MKTYYYRDPNGAIPSDDGKVMYSVLTGKQIIDFFSATENKKRRFLKVSTNEDPNEVWFEVDPAQSHEARKDESRCQYVSKLQRKAGFEVISLESSCSPDCADDTTTLNEVVSLQSASPEDEFLETCDRRDLLSAIKKLPEHDQELINLLFFQAAPFTEQEVADRFGVSHQAIHKRKKRIFEKLKKILSTQGC